MSSFDTGYGAFDVSTIDPKVLKAAIEGVTVLAKTGIETGAAAAEAKRQKEAETKKRKASVAAAPAPAPVVAAPPPAPAVPGWAIALGALGTVAVVGAILYAPKAPPRRTA